MISDLWLPYGVVQEPRLGDGPRLATSEGRVAMTEPIRQWLAEQVPTPNRGDWVAGFRLACAFILPVAVGEWADQPIIGLFVGIGAFMVANADLGESYGQRLRLMVPATIAIAGMTAAGMAVGTNAVAAVVVGVAVLLLSGLTAAFGREATIFGTFVAFAYVIGVGITEASPISIVTVVVSLLAGGTFAMLLSAVHIVGFGHVPDEEPEPWPTLLSRARSRLDGTLMRHACALAIAGGIGLAVVPFTHQSNGAWLVTGALIVLKPGYRDTLRTALLRAGGTVAGAALAGAIAATISNVWALLAVALGLTWVAEATIRYSFAIFVVLITPLSILLTNVFAPGDWQVALLRTADVAAGSAIAIVVATALRERGDQGRATSGVETGQSNGPA